MATFYKAQNQGTQLSETQIPRQLSVPPAIHWAVALLAHSWVSLPKLLIPNDRKAEVMKKETGRLMVGGAISSTGWLAAHRKKEYLEPTSGLLPPSDPTQLHVLQVPISW